MWKLKADLVIEQRPHEPFHFGSKPGMVSNVRVRLADRSQRRPQGALAALRQYDPPALAEKRSDAAEQRKPESA